MPEVKCPLVFLLVLLEDVKSARERFPTSVIYPSLRYPSILRTSNLFDHCCKDQYWIFTHQGKSWEQICSRNPTSVVVSYNVTKLTKRWIEALYGQGWSFISNKVGERFVLLIWSGKTVLLWPWFCTLGNTKPLKKRRGHQDTRFYFRRQNLTSFFVSCNARL